LNIYKSELPRMVMRRQSVIQTFTFVYNDSTLALT